MNAVKSWGVRMAGIVAAMMLTALFGTVYVAAEAARSPSLQPPTPNPTEEAVLLQDFYDSARWPAWGAPGVEEFSFGDMVPVYRFSQAFFHATITESLEDQLIRSPNWLVPVMWNGHITMSFSVFEPDNVPGALWKPHGVRSREVGVALHGLSPDEKVVLEQESRALYAASGTVLRPLNEFATVFVPVTTSLESYQAEVYARYQPLRDLGEFAIGAGGGAQPLEEMADQQEGSVAARRDVVAFSRSGVAGLIAIVLALAVALVVRSSRMTRGRSS